MNLLLRFGKRWQKSVRWMLGWYRTQVEVPFLLRHGKRLRHLERYARRIPFIERREYSQNGEDGIFEAIFTMAGTTNKYFVEFGAEDGVQSNTRYLQKHKGWTGLLMDGGHENPEINLHREFITAENIEQLFKKYNVPEEFDLLSIDVDGNDYWIWKAVTAYRPRVVCIEYNACIPFSPAVTIPYAADFSWDKTDYYGASLSALRILGRKKGYTLVGTDPCGVNAFFVRDDVAAGKFDPGPVEEIYRPAAFKGKPGNAHPKDPSGRSWAQV